MYNNYNNNNNNYIREEKTRNLLRSKYDRPKKTYTDTLQTNKAMSEKLIGYVRVDDIDYVPLNTHVRYVTYREGKQVFRLGGLLKFKHPKYVRLSNGTNHWSVQREHLNKSGEVLFETIFFRILSKQERAEKALEAQNSELEKLREENARLKRRGK